MVFAYTDILVGACHFVHICISRVFHLAFRLIAPGVAGSMAFCIQEDGSEDLVLLYYDPAALCGLGHFAIAPCAKLAYRKSYRNTLKET